MLPKKRARPSKKVAESAVNWGVFIAQFVVAISATFAPYPQKTVFCVNDMQAKKRAEIAL